MSVLTLRKATRQAVAFLFTPKNLNRMQHIIIVKIKEYKLAVADHYWDTGKPEIILVPFPKQPIIVIELYPKGAREIHAGTMLSLN